MVRGQKSEWQQRSDAENFALNVAFLKQHVVPLNNFQVGTPIVFCHVPKNAGTALENLLARNFNLSEILHINAPDLNQLPQIISLKQHFPKFICGHHPLHGLLYQLLPKAALFHLTVLRSPIDRVISYYNYLKGNQQHALHQTVKPLNFTDFIDQSPTPELNNGQTRRFSGFLHQPPDKPETMLKIAQQTLKDCFSLVLVYDQLTAGIKRLQQQLKQPPIKLPKANQSTPFITKNQLPADLIKHIEHQNQADLALYAWAKQNFQQNIKTT